MQTSMMNPISYLFRWRSMVALLGGILAAMAMLLVATSGRSPAQTAVTPSKVIAGGYNHSLAIDTLTGHVYAWGGNTYGQLGVNSNNDHHTPQLVHGTGNQGFLSGIVDVAAGYHHSLAVGNDGTVYAWGGNSYGQLGDGTKVDRHYPVRLYGITDVVAVAAGKHHSLALKSDGSVWAWGRNFYGQLGVNSNNDHYSPTPVHGTGNQGTLTNVVDVAAGDSFSLALKTDDPVQGWPDKVLAWGENDWGQLGVNSDNKHDYPVEVHGPGNTQPPDHGLGGDYDIVDVDAGDDHSLAVASDYPDFTAFAWGCGRYGQLGVNSDHTHDYPVEVHSPPGSFFTMAGGALYSVGVQNLSGGTVWAWGDNMSGQLGHDSPSDIVPEPMWVGLTNVKDVDAGAFHTLAVKNDGTVWAWGDNANGKLGDGTTTDRNYPVQVGGLPGSSSEKDTIKPWVTQVVPADAATGVPRGTKVIASFSEKMDAATINQQTFTLMKDGTTTEEEAKVSYNSATNQATLNPTKPLSKGETYTATVSTSAKDLAGNRLNQNYTSSDDAQPMEWSFTVKN